MRTNEAGGMSRVSCEWRGACAAPRIPSGRASRCGLDRSASRAEPTMVYARRRGSKGLDGGLLAPRSQHPYALALHMTLRARLALGLAIIAVVLLVPLLVVRERLGRLHTRGHRASRPRVQGVARARQAARRAGRRRGSARPRSASSRTTRCTSSCSRPSAPRRAHAATITSTSQDSAAESPRRASSRRCPSWPSAKYEAIKAGADPRLRVERRHGDPRWPRWSVRSGRSRARS